HGLHRNRTGSRFEWTGEADREGCEYAHLRHRSRAGGVGMSARELEGEVALVTGATRGIGRTIAEHLARAGARVAVVGRNVERAEEAADALAGVGHRGYACDVADPEAVAALVKQVDENLGGLDILVNNAGITDD